MAMSCRAPTELPHSALSADAAELRKQKKEEKARQKELKKHKASEKARARAEVCSSTSSCSQGSSAPVREILEGSDMPNTYDPGSAEALWYLAWEDYGYFFAAPDDRRPPFVMVLPPPNVTGVLHIGHALTAAIQDTLARWRRMSGFNVLWLPGLDHAGIATQVVVEKKLMREKGVTKHDLGRERFVQEVWNWVERYGGTICHQLRQLGCSLDWSRQCFTMDERRSKAVVEAFVRLHDSGLIYRNNRLVNWDCTLKTAISDIEVEYRELRGRIPITVPGYNDPVEFGVIYSFAYPIEEKNDEIIIATTRPETMLGDVAVAIHPEDPKYAHLHGKFVIHPFDERKLPIVCDKDLVDMNFGTGAVKVTPAHDASDLLCGERHNLPSINILTDDGKINSFGGPLFQGLPRFEARKAVLKALEKKKLYRGSIDNAMKIGVCSRTGDVIEPLLKPQWYIKCGGLAAQAKSIVKSGELQILPERSKETWYRWLDNIQDWCISRQLWWGHRVPAWYVTLEGDKNKGMGAYDDHWVVARSESEAKKLAGEKFPGQEHNLDQDPDVLDTWFSSAIFPYAALGWPDNTSDFRTFFPTSVLETGHDILFFWVARIVMLGVNLTGQVPFKQVYLHAMVRDAQGRKMSKSLGNVVNPLDVIHGATLNELYKELEKSGLSKSEVEKGKEGLKTSFPKGIPRCGADALRFGLIAYSRQEVSINLDIKIVEAYKRWCNKIWNAVRFAKLHFHKDFVPPKRDLNLSSLPFCCQWIISVLNESIQTTVKSLERFDISAAAIAVYSWWYDYLCNMFIELAKPILSGDSPRDIKCVLDTLWLCMDNGLRLLHPFMPFITEELWQRLPKHYSMKQSIMQGPYPSHREEWRNEIVEAEMAEVDKIAGLARSLRCHCGMDFTNQRGKMKLYVVCNNEQYRRVLNERAAEVSTLADLDSLEVLRAGEHVPPEVVCAAEHLADDGKYRLFVSSLMTPL
ncbi:hypothetical protein GOP47_0010610 [Adiantum capillus-veneris]|uniref:Valine--tRNA ligase, mitochondrial n=1 Tax=Adiantum capillus-veneris TaxID=13818 RepID=A0A9D4ZGJ8_ADICA|nr:hypothetical protein GOP47_0010610 [Adiantum capillus-veneris]